MGDIELTAEEKRSIAALKRVAKNWPQSLWLFTNGDITIMKALPDGGKAHLPGGGFDPGYVVADIPGIPSDGGDW